ncbi:hypothetical protein [Kistimonas asteriae]|uniref:hypothetical protein n=1 Tax=Kistimonas asteriae TaxID=517724 RepID=UPI001BA7BD2D|nr:hypothetical protein [Kistimonas asteriae]
MKINNNGNTRSTHIDKKSDKENVKSGRVEKRGKKRLKGKAVKTNPNVMRNIADNKKAGAQADPSNTMERKNSSPIKTGNVTSQNEAFKKELNKLLQGQLESAPSSNRSQFFVNLSDKAITECLSDIQESASEAKPVEVTLSGQYQTYQDSLDSLKESLGGAPNYQGKKPSLELHKKFLGLPIDTVKTWISKSLEKRWAPRPLWKALGRRFQLAKTGMTHYEYLSLTLQSINKMKQNLSQIQDKLRNKDNACHFFHKATGLTFHEKLNDPTMLANSLNDYIEMFEKHMDKAVREGTLQAFVEEAMPKTDVCFEARMSSMIAYTASHPLDGEDSISLDNIADYSSESSMEDALNEELKVLLMGGNEIAEIDAEYIFDYLVNQRNLVGQKFQGGYTNTEDFAAMIGESTENQEITITEDLLRQYLDYAENILCLF